MTALWRTTRAAFLALLARCEDVSEKHQIAIFTAGLHEPLQTDVELLKPSTLEDAMAYARAYERRLNLPEDDSTTPKPDKTSRRQPPPLPSRMALPPPPAPNAAKTPTPEVPAPPPAGTRFKRLTAAEMAAKRERGECYNCMRNSLASTSRSAP